MVRKLRRVRSELRLAGFGIDRQTGSHQVWEHPLLPGVRVILAGPDSKDARDYEEAQVRKALAALRALQEQRP